VQHKKRFTVSVERRGKYWQARVYFEGEGGNSRRFSTGVAIGERWRESKRAAEKVADEHAAKLANQTSVAVDADNDHSLDAVAERMLHQKMADGRRDRAVEFLAQTIDSHAKPFFGATRDVRTIRRRDLEAFKGDLRSQGYAPTTINNALTGIRQILKFAYEVEESIEAIPIVKNVEVDKRGKGKPITPEQAARFIRSFLPNEREEREFNLFLLNTGLRKHECLAIRWDWVDWKAREVSIPAEVRKGGKPQRVPTQLNEVAFGLLERRRARPEQPSKQRVWWQLKTYDDARRRAAAKAGIAGYRHHDARHTRATQLGAEGATAIDLRDQMGWSTLAMVNRYTHPDKARAKKMADRVQLGASPSRRTRHSGKKDE